MKPSTCNQYQFQYWSSDFNSETTTALQQKKPGAGASTGKVTVVRTFGHSLLPKQGAGTCAGKRDQHITKMKPRTSYCFSNVVLHHLPKMKPRTSYWYQKVIIIIILMPPHPQNEDEVVLVRIPETEMLLLASRRVTSPHKDQHLHKHQFSCRKKKNSVKCRPTQSSQSTSSSIFTSTEPSASTSSVISCSSFTGTSHFRHSWFLHKHPAFTSLKTVPGAVGADVIHSQEKKKAPSRTQPRDKH